MADPPINYPYPPRKIYYFSVGSYLLLLLLLLLFYSSTKSPDIVQLKHAMIQHQRRVITGSDEDDTQRIHVRRKFLFTDTLKGFSRHSFTSLKC